MSLTRSSACKDSKGAYLEVSMGLQGVNIISVSRLQDVHLGLGFRVEELWVIRLRRGCVGLRLRFRIPAHGGPWGCKTLCTTRA